MKSRYELCVDYFSKLKRCSWRDYDINELKKIIEYYDANIKKAEALKRKPYAYLLRDSVMAYIYLAQDVKNPCKEYHIELSEAAAEKWKNYYSEIEPDSLFYCGIFKFMKALRRSLADNDMTDFDLAKDLLRNCREAYSKDKISKKFKQPMYLIGENTSSLSGLIMFDDKDNPQRKLKMFNGEVKKSPNENSASHILFKGHRISCDIKNAAGVDSIQSVEIGQKNQHQYYIGIKRSTLFAYKYKKNDIYDC